MTAQEVNDEVINGYFALLDAREMARGEQKTMHYYSTYLFTKLDETGQNRGLDRCVFRVKRWIPVLICSWSQVVKKVRCVFDALPFRSYTPLI